LKVGDIMAVHLKTVAFHRFQSIWKAQRFELPEIARSGRIGRRTSQVRRRDAFNSLA
jgi:hypothetical protein